MKEKTSCKEKGMIASTCKQQHEDYRCLWVKGVHKMFAKVQALRSVTNHLLKMGIFIPYVTPAILTAVHNRLCIET
jgi:hypothetical protein